MIKGFGYVNFYLLLFALALPGIVLFLWIIRWSIENSALGTARDKKD